LVEGVGGRGFFDGRRGRDTGGYYSNLGETDDADVVAPNGEERARGGRRDGAL
jgi:hypothetical protein